MPLQRPVECADFVAGERRIVLTDGRTAVADMDAAAREAAGAVARSTYAPAVSAAMFTTSGGDEVLAELPTTIHPTQARLGDGVVVYLDQNHWRTIREVLHGDRTRVTRDQVGAAEWIVNAVSDRRLVTPSRVLTSSRRASGMTRAGRRWA